MSPTDMTRRKQSLYFPEEMIDEIRAESTRQGRSVSWVVQRAWILSADQIRKFPGDPTGTRGKEK